MTEEIKRNKKNENQKDFNLIYESFYLTDYFVNKNQREFGDFEGIFETQNLSKTFENKKFKKKRINSELEIIFDECYSNLKNN